MGVYFWLSANTKKRQIKNRFIPPGFKRKCVHSADECILGQNTTRKELLTKQNKNAYNALSGKISVIKTQKRSR